MNRRVALTFSILFFVVVGMSFMFLAAFEAFGGFMKNEMGTAQEFQKQGTEIFQIVQEQRNEMGRIREMVKELSALQDKVQTISNQTVAESNQFKKDMDDLRQTLFSVPEVKLKLLEAQVLKLEKAMVSKKRTKSK